MSKYEFGPWMIWNGGECPVEDGVMGQVQCARSLRREAMKSHARDLSLCQWEHCEDGGDIIAYRTVKEPKKHETIMYWDEICGLFWSSAQTNPTARKAIFTVKGEEISARWA